MTPILKDNATKHMSPSKANLMAIRFEEVFSNMPMACFTFDKCGAIQQWNKSAENMLGLSARKVTSTTSWHFPPSSKDGLWGLDFLRDVFKGIPIAGREWRFRTATTERHLICDVFPVRAHSGKVIGAISANLDITDRMVEERLAKLQVLQLSLMSCDLEMRNVALERANTKLEQYAVRQLTGPIDR